MPTYWIKLYRGTVKRQVVCDADANINTLKEVVKRTVAPRFDDVSILEIFVKTPHGVALSPHELVGNPEPVQGCHFIVSGEILIFKNLFIETLCLFSFIRRI